MCENEWTWVGGASDDDEDSVRPPLRALFRPGLVASEPDDDDDDDGGGGRDIGMR